MRITRLSTQSTITIKIMTIQIRRLALLVTLIVAVWCDQSYAGKQVSTSPDINDRQDVIEHLLRAAEACKSLSENLRERKRCIAQCSRYARIKKKRPTNSAKVDKGDWKRCKESQDIAFRADLGAEKKEKQSTNKKIVNIVSIPAVKVTEFSPTPNPGLEGHTTWRVMYNLGAKKYLAFITLDVSNNKVTGRIDTVSQQPGTYELVGETVKDGKIVLKSDGVIASARSNSRHNGQAVNLRGELGSDGITMEGEVEGAKDSGRFKALKFKPDIRSPRPDGLFVKKHQRNKGPDVSIKTCRDIFNWLSEESNEQINYQMKIPTQLYSGSFFGFFGIPYDQCTMEHRIIFDKLRNNCSNKLRKSGTVDDSKLVSKYQKNINPFYQMMFLNKTSGRSIGSYPVFPKNHSAFIEQPNYHNFLLYFHYIGLRDGKTIMEQRVKTVENKKELGKEDLVTIDELLAELKIKPSKNNSPLTRIAAADIGEYKKRLNLLHEKYNNQKADEALQALSVVPGTMLSSNPDPNDKQDIMVHLRGVAKACEGLPGGQPGRDECVSLCSRLADEKKRFEVSSDINLRGWMSCKDKQDEAFGIFYQDYPVKRNDYAWGYDETDSYWYGGQVIDFDAGKVLLVHSEGGGNWYSVQDVRKFIPKGRVEVNKNDQRYQAVITDQDLMGNVLVRYTGSLPQSLQKFQAKTKRPKSIGDVFASYTKDPRYDPEKVNEQARIVRKRMGFDENMESVSIKKLSRVSVGDSSTWAERLAMIIKDNQADVRKVFSFAQPLIEESLSDEFKDFADDYFNSWIKEQVNSYKENIPKASLLEVAGATVFVTNLPEPSQIQVLEKVKNLLLTSSSELKGLIEQRIVALESQAIKIIRESGAGYADAETVYETGLASAEKFEEAGYIEQSQIVIKVTTKYIDQLLKSNLRHYKQELKIIDFTDESYVALEEQASGFEKMSAELEGFKAYQEAALQALQEGRSIVCGKALKKAKVKLSNFNKQISIGREQVGLLDLACDLRERGHAVFEFSRKGFSKNYILGIEEENGTANRFLVKPDKTTSGKGLKVSEILGDEKNPITQIEWQEYIMNLAYEPPIFKKIDKIAHPNDPDNPANLAGLTDEELVELPGEKIEKLIDKGLPYAKKAEEPRYLFALGRAEWLHGDDERAFEILSLAADKGSAAANAYLARITNDLDQSEAFLQLAIGGGFKPAQKWLAELKQFQAQEEEEVVSHSGQEGQAEDIDFNSFSLGYVMRAFYEGNTQQYTQEPIGYLTYVRAVSDTLSDQGMLFMMENPKAYVRELDPNLSFEVDRKMLTNRTAMRQGIDSTYGVLFDALGKMMVTRQAGGSIEDEILTMNESLLGGGENQEGRQSYLTLLEVKNRGLKDGRILAFMFEDNTEAFRKIYKGMQRFVREQM